MKKPKNQARSRTKDAHPAHPFRVFISYSHLDVKLIRTLVSLLKQNGLVPIWDDNIQPGSPLTTEIRDMIDHSHVFIPFITKQSEARPLLDIMLGPRYPFVDKQLNVI